MGKVNSFDNQDRFATAIKMLSPCPTTLGTDMQRLLFEWSVIQPQGLSYNIFYEKCLFFVPIQQSFHVWNCHEQRLGVKLLPTYYDIVAPMSFLKPKQWCSFNWDVYPQRGWRHKTHKSFETFTSHEMNGDWIESTQEMAVHKWNENKHGWAVENRDRNF